MGVGMIVSVFALEKRAGVAPAQHANVVY